MGQRLYKVVSGNFLAATPTLLIAGVAGKKIRVYGYNLSLLAANNVQFYAEDGLGVTPISGIGYGVIGGSEVDEPVFETGVGQQLDLWMLNAGSASIQLRYELVSE